MVTELLRKYIWLLQVIMRTGETGMTLDEISDEWERRFDSPYSRRTFNNHRIAIEDIFGIRIECNRTSNRYYISNYGVNSDRRGGQGDGYSEWLINTFTVNNMHSLARERLSGRISVEDIPSGHIYLTSVMQAMTDGFKIKISYQKYTSSGASVYTLLPYAVKEADRRWYVVGYCEERNGMRVFGLDRVKNLEICAESFRIPKDFDIEELYATSFGIYLPEGPGRLVTFRTDETEARFLRDLPIHRSQKEEFSDGGFVTFSIFVCPNRNLIMEFCKRGSKIEVLSPEDVREQVRSELRAAADLYGK